MSNADQRWLVGRIQTQVMYGSRVEIVERRGSWVKVVVPDQPSQYDARGYPGWLPAKQLTTNLSLLQQRSHHPLGIVVKPTAWVMDPHTLSRRFRVAFGTRLVIVGTTSSRVIFLTPGGGKLAISRQAVRIYASPSKIEHPTGGQVLATARDFLGLPYVYGGTSGFGFDCSGLTYSIYARYGITIPRDADQQALRGAWVQRDRLRPGDLLFFAGTNGAGPVHHVALYAGNSKMLDSPDIGGAVRITPMATLGDQYAGARRML